MLPVSDKPDSVNECTQEISELMKLQIQGMWQNAHKFIRQPAHLVLTLGAKVDAVDRVCAPGDTV